MMAFIVSAMIIPAVLLVFSPINLTVGIILAIACYVGICAALVFSSPIIEVDASTLRVGSARVPLAYVGEVTAHLDRDQARHAAGPGLDARAWICLRGWAPLSVRTEITDERDPVPYWLFSTRQPAELKRALDAAKSQLHSR